MTQADPARTYTTIPAELHAAAARCPDTEAIVDGPRRMTFAELDAEARRFGRALIGAGVGPGDRVSIWMPNRARWIVAALGILCAGATLVPLNTRYKGAEARHILSASRAVALVVEDGFLGNGYVDMLRERAAPGADRLVAGLPDLRLIVTSGDVTPSGTTSWEEFAAAAAGVSPDELDRRERGISPEDISDVLYTSGTTGLPKGVMIAHRQNLVVDAAWSEAVGLTAGDRYLLVNPLFHSFGYRAGLLACLLTRATMVLQAVFDVGEILRLVDRERITVLPGAPTVYSSLLDSPDRPAGRLGQVRVAVTGAATIPPRLIERVRDELGIPVVLSAYGLTESCGTATICPPGTSPADVATTCGRAIPGTEVAVFDPRGRRLPPGEVGEVRIRGVNVMRGYLDDPAATAAAIDDDGWLRTGDLGLVDERGFLRITDRLKDMYVVGGFNAYPAEIERVLARHPGVSEAAVIGVADARLGEVGHAFVIERPGAGLTEADVIAYCRENLANYKVPRRVTVVRELPRTASGKVVKGRLRDEMAGGGSG